MTVKKTLLFLVLTFAIAMLSVPATASAFKIVKAAGGAITKHTDIHFIADSEFTSFGSTIKCEINGTLTTKDGTEANTSITNVKLITNSCTFTNFYEGCKIKGDVVGQPPGENVVIDKNAFTFNYLALLNLEGAGCALTYSDFEFKPMSVTVGTGPINVGVTGGEGIVEDDTGTYEASASGEWTLGQYTEAGVNQGAAKGVFKIE